MLSTCKRRRCCKSNAWDYEIVLAVTHPGDAEYKPAVQQAHLFVPARNRQGAEQHISFPPIPDQKAGTKSLQLNATSDANVPVHYLVREGPVEITGDMLTFAKDSAAGKISGQSHRGGLAIWPFE